MSKNQKANETVAENTDAQAQAEGQTNEAEASQEQKLEAFSFSEVNKATVKDISEAIWARVEGKNHDEKSEVLSALFTAMREARDGSKNTRPRKSVAELLAESINKPMGDLQTVKVQVGGITLALPQIVKAATVEAGKETPFTPAARAWMDEHNLSTLRKKVTSRGKESLFLVKKGTTDLPAKETEQAAA